MVRVFTRSSDNLSAFISSFPSSYSQKATKKALGSDTTLRTSPPSSSFSSFSSFQKAIELVKKATDADNDQKYEEAQTLYLHSVNIFMRILKCKSSSKPILQNPFHYNYGCMSLATSVPASLSGVPDLSSIESCLYLLHYVTYIIAHPHITVYEHTVACLLPLFQTRHTVTTPRPHPPTQWYIWEKHCILV